MVGAALEEPLGAATCQLSRSSVAPACVTRGLEPVGLSEFQGLKRIGPSFLLLLSLCLPFPLFSGGGGAPLRRSGRGTTGGLAAASQRMRRARRRWRTDVKALRGFVLREK
ncbi:hypothetical protein Taro_026183 [Colocasia esculenta]|uniref:Uncharacterized protein n=1 Tax=Colocasia esculenta TaxID=4460 RepID=A0A843VGF0_COLES|nr:hypothetical protein [Colocasia esculenta]